MFHTRKSKVVLILLSFLLITIPVNLASASLTKRANHQAAFVKAAPLDGFITASTVAISWTASNGATQYAYCYDTINNSACDTVWTSTSSIFVTLNGLSTATYYWQVRATGPNGTVYANNGVWWSFYVSFIPTMTATSTATITRTPTRTFTPLPTRTYTPTRTATSTLKPFVKTEPLNNAIVKFSSVDLKWSPYHGSSLIVNYEYCYDTSNNNICDISWRSNGTSTSILVNQLKTNTTYYWQVRALIPSSPNQIVYPTNGWWTFTVQLPTTTPIP